MEERPTIWRVAANILNKQSGEPTRGGPPGRGLGKLPTTPQGYEILTQKASHQALVNAVMNLQVPYNAGNFMTS
jgi:hypothetical protein